MPFVQDDKCKFKAAYNFSNCLGNDIHTSIHLWESQIGCMEKLLKHVESDETNLNSKKKKFVPIETATLHFHKHNCVCLTINTF